MRGAPEKAALTRLLVVEDDERLFPGLRLLLSERWNLTFVSDAKGALASVARHVPDVALVDLGLPDMDGVDLLRTLHAAHPVLPLLVLTVATAERRILAA